MATTSEHEPPPTFEEQALHERLVQIAMAEPGFEPVAGYPILDWTVPPS